MPRAVDPGGVCWMSESVNICHLCVVLRCLTYISRSFHCLGWLLDSLILHLFLDCRKAETKRGGNVCQSWQCSSVKYAKHV